jgi:hypothetical protein
MHGSRQLRQFRTLIRDGATLEVAATQAGLSLTEAKLTVRADEADPPPPEAYEPIGGDNRMSRKNNEVETVRAPDFAKMKRIFLHDISPAQEKTAKSRGDLSAAWKMIEDDCNCNKRAAKLLHKLYGESEETRDDFLRTLYGGMKALGIGISADLVDQMNDEDAPTMPTVPSNGMGAEGMPALQ